METIMRLREQAEAAHRMQMAATDARARANWAAHARELREQIERLEGAASAKLAA